MLVPTQQKDISMRKYFFLAIIGATCLTAPGVAMAQEVSGDFGVELSYIDDDGSDYSNGPGATGSLNILLGKPCQLQFWGWKSFHNTDGDEFDKGLSCSVHPDEKTELTGTVSHFSLVGDDMVKLEGSINHETSIGTVDLKVGQYLWTHGDNQNATRLQIGFSPAIADDFDLRIFGARQTGFDLDPITTIGADVEYRLREHFSLTANLVAPVSKHAGDQRGFQFTVGAHINF